MSDYVIIADATCDLTSAMQERFDIPDILHGILYYPDGHSEPQDPDWNNISAEEFYHSMRNKNVMYKTAAPPLGEITEVFEKHLSQGKDILNISISSGLSSCYNDCQLVAKDLLEKYPGRKIICVDSLRYSTSLGLLVMSTAMKRKEGATLEEAAAYAEEEKYKIHQMGIMDDLFFLVKKGRISNFKAFFGSMVGLNLLADLNDTGMAEVIAKFKGKRDAFAADVEYIRRTIVNPEEQTIFVAHSNRADAAKLYADMIQKEIAPKEIIITEVCQGCGANIGPGLCAAFYKGNPVSKGLETEKAIMAEIEKQIKGK